VVFGCGYVGTAVAREAMTRGYRVIALTRNPAKAIALKEYGITTVVDDLASDHWHAAIRGPARYVLNAVSSGGGGVEGYRHSYLAGMNSIVRWAQSAGPIGTMLYTSSTSVYPQGDGAIVDESAPTEGTTERGAILCETERMLTDSRGVFERWFVLRLAGIYGPNRHHLLEQVRMGEVAGLGEHRLNLIYRDDIVRAIWCCFDAPPKVANQVFNVADDSPTPKRDVVAWLAEGLGCPEPRFTGEPAGGRRAVTPDRVIANGKIRAMLGWRPAFRDFRAGYSALLSC
jgi:nucleoside-diphosphate-sugar epimerase